MRFPFMCSAPAELRGQIDGGLVGSLGLRDEFEAVQMRLVGYHVARSTFGNLVLTLVSKSGTFRLIRDRSEWGLQRVTAESGAVRAQWCHWPGGVRRRTFVEVCGLLVQTLGRQSDLEWGQPAELAAAAAGDVVTPIGLVVLRLTPSGLDGSEHECVEVGPMRVPQSLVHFDGRGFADSVNALVTSGAGRVTLRVNPSRQSPMNTIRSVMDRETADFTATGGKGYARYDVSMTRFDGRHFVLARSWPDGDSSWIELEDRKH